MAVPPSIAGSVRLLAGMITRLGLHVANDFDTGPAGPAPVIADMAVRCRACEAQAECDLLQARNDRLDTPPTYCANHTRLAAAVARAR